MPRLVCPPIDLEFLDEGSAIAVPAPSPLGLRPEPVPVSAIRRVSTIAGDLCVMALIVLAVWLALVVTP